MSGAKGAARVDLDRPFRDDPASVVAAMNVKRPASREEALCVSLIQSVSGIASTAIDATFRPKPSSMLPAFSPERAPPS